VEREKGVKRRGKRAETKGKGKGRGKEISPQLTFLAMPLAVQH